ncbi:MAG: arginine--tRNA ligase [Patescibacteria group bacterium]
MKQEIKEIIAKAIGQVFPGNTKIDFNVEVSPEEKIGDYSTNAALVLGKKVGERPEEIAEKIIKIIRELDDQMIGEIEVAKPGFINLKIALPYLQNQISKILVAGEKYGNSDLGKDLKVNIEFISANPTGPLTLGNGRGGYAGDCLANIFKSFGAEVEREYFINDRGAQIIKLGHSILKDKEALYRGNYIEKIADQISHFHTAKYSSGKPEEIGQMAVPIIMEEYIKKTIYKMGIKFDHWFSESGLYKGAIEKAIGILDSHQLTYKKDGALWLKTTDCGDDKDRVLITKDKEFTYFAGDIAYHYDKIRRGYNLLVDFWGADHHGYQGRMQAAIEILRQQEHWSGELKILISQLVRLVSKGQEIKMSKRQGTYVTMDELLDQVGKDVTRFFFLERNLNTHLDFDLDLAREKSQKNPVYYVQYAYARIHSILEKVKSKKEKVKTSAENLKLLKEPPELSLSKELIKLPDIIVDTSEDYQMQRLPYYSTELARKFHNFYEKCRVISDDKELTAARIGLIKATQIVLKKTLDLMGISAPEKM